jgi:redox-sensing transcriptional repressor
MAGSKYISISVIKRLPRYYRFLELLKSEGLVRISSQDLANRMGLSASQIRQDLNCFGGFGQQGYGYNVDVLYEEIGKILGLENGYKTILIGAGNLGHAIATYMDFKKRGFDLIGIFDKNEAISGQLIKDIPIRTMDSLEEFCNDQKPEVAILCIPHAAAAQTVDTCIGLGIKGFWNFTHYDIASKYPDAAVQNVHLADSLMTLCYQVKND